METEKEQLLRNPDVYPSDEVLAAALGDSYGAYETFTQKLPDFGIETEWRYYNDGKSWLRKNNYKKKNMFWLSVWDGFFKVALFFTQKTNSGIYDLQISDEIKTRFTNEKHIGKLIPLVIEVHDESVLEDAYKVIAYKQSAK